MDSKWMGGSNSERLAAESSPGLECLRAHAKCGVSTPKRRRLERVVQRAVDSRARGGDPEPRDIKSPMLAAVREKRAHSDGLVPAIRDEDPRFQMHQHASSTVERPESKGQEQSCFQLLRWMSLKASWQASGQRGRGRLAAALTAGGASGGVPASAQDTMWLSR